MNQVMTPELFQVEVLDQKIAPAAKVAPSKKSLGIGEMTKNLLTRADEKGFGLTYQTILSMLQDEFGSDRSSIHCVRWYASKLNKSGIETPKFRK